MNTFDKLNNAANRMGETNDCSVKALAAVCSISYSKAHALMAKQGRKPRRSFPRWVWLRWGHRLGVLTNEPPLLGLKRPKPG